MNGRRWSAAAVLVACGGGAFLLPQTGTPGASSAAAATCDATSGIVPASTGAVRAPITGAFTVTSEFGPRNFGGRGAEMHNGIDLATSAPAPIVAMTGGTVTFAGPAGNAGNMVTVDHGNGVASVSMHLASIAVRQGQPVAAGQTLGIEGNTGDSTGMHLHFEVRVNGAPTNPRDWLAKAGVILPAQGGWATAAGASTTPSAARAGQPPTGCHPTDIGVKDGTIPAGFASWITKASTVCPIITAPVLAAQIDAESGWNPRATSPVGAQGPSQFMPGTWAAYGRDDDGNGVASPFDIGDAVMAQARYDCAISKQLENVPGDRLDNTLAGYNAGPGAVIAHGGVPPYAETRAYVAKIKSLAVSKYGRR